MASINGFSINQRGESMKAFHLAVVSTTFAFSSLGSSPAWAADTHVMVMPADLKWVDVPSLPPGAKIAVIEGPMNEAVPFTVRLKLPADYKVPAHWHPAIEHVTVISGTFNMGTGDKLDQSKTTPLSAGSVAIMQPKTNHFAWTKEETIIQAHGVGPWAVNYVNPADDPRTK
jgi:anti-sigma factor ChrR (cupin superfamily)